MLARPPSRPAWIEIDLTQLRRNFFLIHQDKPRSVQILSVVKDDAYGHGAPPVAQIALESGATGCAVATLDEGLALRQCGVRAPILMLGERHPTELRACVENQLTVCVSELGVARELARWGERLNRALPVHVKLDTGMSRYGVRWEEALNFFETIAQLKPLRLQGVLSHFAMSDELDKSFACLQLERFQTALRQLEARGLRPTLRHLCNSGGLLDLPQAHFDMVRIGILPLGVYPSSVCRRIPGLAPALTIKARLAAIQNIAAGDTVGYGLRYRAPSPRRIAVIPIGYGDGFPRIRNQGHALIHGRRAPLIGSVSMDALTVDITDIPDAHLWDEAVLLGRDGGEEISVHDLARLKNSVSYDVLAGWRSRLPRIYRDEPVP